MMICLLGYFSQAMALPRVFTDLGIFGYILYIAMVLGLMSVFNSWRARRRDKEVQKQMEMKEEYERKARMAGYERQQREEAARRRNEKDKPFYVDPEGNVGSADFPGWCHD